MADGESADAAWSRYQASGGSKGEKEDADEDEKARQKDEEARRKAAQAMLGSLDGMSEALGDPGKGMDGGGGSNNEAYLDQPYDYR